MFKMFYLVFALTDIINPKICPDHCHFLLSVHTLCLNHTAVHSPHLHAQKSLFFCPYSENVLYTANGNEYSIDIPI